MTNCDQIAHRIAAGEPLNEDQHSHAEICTSCSAATGATDTLRAIGRARAQIEPGPGFSSRMANRAWERVARRKRGRIASYALATSGAVACAALALVLLRGGDDPAAQAEQSAAAPAASRPMLDEPEPVTPAESEAAHDLIWLTDADRALSQSANWEFIEEPVAPYALLLDESALEEQSR